MQEARSRACLAHPPVVAAGLYPPPTRATLEAIEQRVFDATIERVRFLTVLNGIIDISRRLLANIRQRERFSIALHQCVCEALETEEAAAPRGIADLSELSSVTNMCSPHPTAGCFLGSSIEPGTAQPSVLSWLARKETPHPFQPVLGPAFGANRGRNGNRLPPNHVRRREGYRALLRGNIPLIQGPGDAVWSPPPSWGRVRVGGTTFSNRVLVPPTPTLPHKGGGRNPHTVGRSVNQTDKLPPVPVTSSCFANPATTGSFSICGATVATAGAPVACARRGPPGRVDPPPNRCKT
jgi:hypothetical protein